MKTATKERWFVGQWGADRCRGDHDIQFSYTDPSGSIHSGHVGVVVGEVRAHLIAAAPTLLQALRDLLEWAEDNAPWMPPDAPDRYDTATLDAARAAIADATGE